MLVALSQPPRHPGLVAAGIVEGGAIQMLGPSFTSCQKKPGKYELFQIYESFFPGEFFFVHNFMTMNIGNQKNG